MTVDDTTAAADLLPLWIASVKECWQQCLLVSDVDDELAAALWKAEGIKLISEIERLRKGLRAAKDRAADNLDYAEAAMIRDVLDSSEATPA